MTVDSACEELSSVMEHLVRNGEWKWKVEVESGQWKWKVESGKKEVEGRKRKEGSGKKEAEKKAGSTVIVSASVSASLRYSLVAAPTINGMLKGRRDDEGTTKRVRRAEEGPKKGQHRDDCHASYTSYASEIYV